MNEGLYFPNLTEVSYYIYIDILHWDSYKSLLD